MELDSGKLRVDSWISSRINGISRARVQSSIRSGLVSVNGHIVNKVAYPFFRSFFYVFLVGLSDIHITNMSFSCFLILSGI